MIFGRTPKRSRRQMRKPNRNEAPSCATAVSSCFRAGVSLAMPGVLNSCAHFLEFLLMKNGLPLSATLFLCLLVSSVRGADEIEWEPQANMDKQLFPSLIIATASMRPVEENDQAETPDPYMLGDRFGHVG